MSGYHTHRRTFSSLDEFVKASQAPKSRHWMQEFQSQRKGQKDWFGTSNFEAAIQLANEGWTKGRQMVDANIKEIFDTGAATTADALYRSYDLAGALPDVPLYCAGEMECMYNTGDDHRAQKPVMRLWVCVEVNCGVDASTMINRAAAVSALVAELESQGHSLEVSAIFGCGNHATKDMYHWTVELKQAGQMLSLDDIAFGLGHPAMQRRINFAIAESDDWVASHSGGEYQRGYGCAIGLREGQIPDDVIYLRHLTTGDNRTHRTPEEAMNATRKLFEAQLDAKLQDA